MATADAQESRMHRLRVGDVVTYVDATEWPPTTLEGPIVAFANVECTYLSIDFGDAGTKELTEDEVTRVA
jgi:hypothetical protein